MKSLADFADSHLRIFDRPPPKPDTRTIYLIGICGTGMGALAGLLKEAGYVVYGSDRSVYPPMSTFLQEQKIPVHNGYSAKNLMPAPDLVIPGNSCRPTHPEAAAAREQSLPQLSFPEALNYFFLQSRRNLVVTGTHGKTTTAGMLVHVLRSAGRDPGFLVGGVLQNIERSFSVGTDPHFVVEGDEYDSAYFDKRPKFLHYAPKVAIITSVEFDHADVYASPKEYHEAFAAFTDLIPDDGLLVVCGDTVRLRTSSAPILTYGLDQRYDVAGHVVDTSENGTLFRLLYRGDDLGLMRLPMHGTHNLQNALAVSAVALHEGVTADELSHGLASFPGVKRRQEVLGEPGGILVVDDFAHHPTAVCATIESAVKRWPNRPLLAVFEPRSNSSRRKIFESSYGEAFRSATKAYLSSPPFRHNDQKKQFLDIQAVTDRIRELGTEAQFFTSTPLLLESLVQDACVGDVILIMSNGGFDGLHQHLLKALTHP